MKTQASTTLTRGELRPGAMVLVALLACVCALAPASVYASIRTSSHSSSHVRHSDAWARQQFAKAERMREALNGRPLAERTRHGYQIVIDSYRRVYLGSPSSSKADPSVVATAELMVEMGRRFDDDKILRGAIDQYRFLRKEYPGSKYRCDALFTIGEIYKDDLNDPDQARATFADFVHRYPHNRLVEDARAAVKEMDAAAAAKEQSATKAAGKQRASNTKSDTKSGSRSASSAGADTTTAGNEEPGESANAVDTRRNELPRVTGVRHWSTPDYTRVAIDVEQEVKFASQRISHPDRIFFDLRGTKLASTLVGKTFDVDDGFLKKIRVAEFQPGRTRIVLEVDDLASYDAFLLPDPYRLIIDIHGKQKRTMGIADADPAGSSATAPMDSSSAADTSDDSGEAVASPGRLTRDQQKTHRTIAKDAAASGQAGLVETDLPAETPGDLPQEDQDSGANSNHHDSGKVAGSNGVIKTTVAVPGSNRRIPKTIVEADDDDSAKTLASLERKLNSDMASARDDSTLDDQVAGGEAKQSGKTKSGKIGTTSEKSETAALTADPSSSSSASASTSSTSSPSPRRRKSHVATETTASDAADLATDEPMETHDVAREASPTAAGGRSLTRALGLKIGKIVIDPGHGGHDTGTIGPNGLMEKDVVLDVGKRLGRMLESRLGAEVVYTRRDDTFIPLETRTAIANRERADLFISIHANSSHDADARGVETYYLNFTSSPEALEVAARENAVSEKSIYELQDLVKKIALKEKIDESREFASDVQESLFGGLSLGNSGIRNRGVKKAPFIVLIGANMPSILAEISFVSNPTDAREMETAERRKRIAESLYRGVAKYVNGLSGVRVASKIDKPEGQ